MATPKLYLIAIAFLSLLLTTFTACLAAVPDEWTRLYQLGDRALFVGSYKEAQHYYSNALGVLNKLRTKPLDQEKLTLLKLTQSFVLDNNLKLAEISYEQLKKTMNIGNRKSSAEQTFLIGLDTLADAYERKGNRYNEPLYLEHALELSKVVSGTSHLKYNNRLRLLGNAYLARAEFTQALASI